MLSAAIAARLATDVGLIDAVADALAFVHDALSRAAGQPHPRLAKVEMARCDRGHLTLLPSTAPSA
jgi:hydroxymethylpyrimidine/phosphomethylpyrimidine kinase